METRLKILEKRGLISTWHDRLIRPGDQFAEEIDVNLESADIILLLVSADFIGSGHYVSQEIKLAMERHQSGDAKVIPVILRDVAWADTPFGRLKPLPDDGKALAQWADRDSAWRNVSEGIEARRIHTSEVISDKYMTCFSFRKPLPSSAAVTNGQAKKRQIAIGSRSADCAGRW